MYINGLRTPLGQNQGYTNSGYMSLLVRMRVFQRYMTCLYRHVIYRHVIGMSYIGMSYIVGKPRISAFHLAGLHDHVFVYTVAASFMSIIGITPLIMVRLSNQFLKAESELYLAFSTREPLKACKFVTLEPTILNSTTLCTGMCVYG